MAADIIPLVFRFQDLTEFLDLILEPEQMRQVEQLFIEAGVDFSVRQPIGPVQLRAVGMGHTGEQFHVVHRIVRRNAHDRAHLIALAIHVRRMTFSSDMIRFFIDHIILITFLFQIHTG